MKKFKEILPVLETANRELPQTDAPCLPKDVSEWIDALPFCELRQADDACRVFASTLTWPQMSNELRAQVHLRIQQANQFARAMASHAIPKEQGNQTLEFLLIDLWYQSAHEWSSEFFKGM